MPSEALGPASLAMGQAVTSFSIFLPSFTAVRQGSRSDKDLCNDVRMGEFAAATIAIGVGVIASSLSGSPAPAFVAVIMSVVLIALYEKALYS